MKKNMYIYIFISNMLVVFGTGVAYYFLKIVYWEESAYTTCFFKGEITLYMCHAPLLGGKK